jgi:hypothetical protein
MPSRSMAARMRSISWRLSRSLRGRSSSWLKAACDMGAMRICLTQASPLRSTSMKASPIPGDVVRIERASLPIKHSPASNFSPSS